MKDNRHTSLNILMVCLGNICRSPLAQGILMHKVRVRGLNWTIDSAGTGNWHVGAPPHPLSQKVALQNGIDISRLQARQFKPHDLQQFDYIFCMDQQNLRDVLEIAAKHGQGDKCRLLLDMLPGEAGTAVPDPYYEGWDSYTRLYTLLDAACDAVIEQLTLHPDFKK